MKNTFLSLLRTVAFGGVYRSKNCGKLVVESNRFLSRFPTMGCGSSTIDLATKEDEGFIEGIVCKNDEIGENHMVSVDLADAGKILLVRQNGKLTAIGATCTHYGAPLVGGALGNGRVRCPWHGACFNVVTGDIEDFPGLDSLPCYQVKVENNNVTVRARRSEIEAKKRQRAMCKRDTASKETFVILGGGPAGGTCVETLRGEGFTGRIVVVAKENALPYDRVKVSKAMDSELEKIQFRSEEFYKEHGIEIMKGISATSVDTKTKVVTLSDKATLTYDKLFIATGSAALKVNIPGADLKNVEILRDFEDGTSVNSKLTPDKEVIILGGSYIAMEAAAYCVSKVKKVTVVMRGDAPFKSLVGARIGTAFMKLYEEKKVHFIKNSGLKRCIDGGNGTVGSVELLDGKILKANLCIMGTGSKLNTEFLKKSGVNIGTDGSIEVDEFMKTNVPNVFAGGDLAYAPVWSYHNRKSTIGHYPLAHMHGRIAALNMLAKETPLKAVPFFWTMLFGKGIRYAGHGKYSDIMYGGDVESLKFVAFYLDGDEVVAMSSCQMDPYVSKFAEILAQGKKLHRKDLAGEDLLNWVNK